MKNGALPLNIDVNSERGMLRHVPVDGEDKCCTVKSKTEPDDNETVPVDVEAVPMYGEDKYCTWKN